MSPTRAEWQAAKDEDHRRTGSWGFDPMMPWSIANWRERGGIVVFYVIMWGGVFPIMLISALWLFGTMIEGISRYDIEHDRCLKHATNGYEIRACR